MTFKEFRKSLTEDGAQGELPKAVFISLITSFVILAIFYIFRLRYIENFIPKYGFYLFFVILSYSLILPSLRHVRVYKELPCMAGMMIGMTLGMISGFLAGFFVASTNGMFVGSVFGMFIGIVFGILTGKCCGIMGVMEGMMAGFMGGLMGAMTSIMLLNDNLKAIGVILFIVSGVILIGLNYLIYKETKEIERRHRDSNLFIISWSFVLTVITLVLMVFGPRSALFS